MTFQRRACLVVLMLDPVADLDAAQPVDDLHLVARRDASDVAWDGRVDAFAGLALRGRDVARQR